MQRSANMNLELMIILVCYSTVSLGSGSSNSSGLQSDQCVLPAHPEHGTYTANGVPGQHFDVLVLNITCDSGYHVKGKETVFCIHGIWNDNMPECTRYCKLDRHPSVVYSCNVENSETSRECKEYEPSGTLVSPKCQTPFYYNPGGLTPMLCIEDKWNYTATCTPDCGIATPDGKELIVGGASAKHGDLPWHAGIYSKESRPYMQICGGTLITTTVVISAAHCFWRDATKLQPPTNYAVALGKVYRPWNEPHDIYAQKSNVTKIIVPDHYSGAAANFQEDIALVFLSSAIQFSIFVRPVCINFNDFFERKQLKHGNLGKVTGWGLTSRSGNTTTVLKMVELPYVDINSCFAESPLEFQEYITSDKFCAGYKNGTALCKGDSGGGLVFSDEEQGTKRFYLRGVVSTAPRDGDNPCNVNVYTGFTQIVKHKYFITEHIADLNEHSRPCRLDPHPSVEYLCTSFSRNKFRPCSEYEPSQTIVEPKCRTNFVFPGNLEPMTCNDGYWNYIAICVPDVITNKDCGILPPAENELAAEGSSPKHGQLPWHAAVYSKLVTPYKQICAGSLISDSVVISDAFCFLNGSELLPSSDYAVALGKIYRRWDDPRDPDAQKSDVTKIVLLEPKWNIQYCTALVFLTTTIQYNTIVRPVCLNFYQRFQRLQMRNDNLAKAAGWSISTEGRAEDPVLKVVDLPYIEEKPCLNEFPKFRYDTICARNKNVSGFCRSDAGGGLAFPDTYQGVERYFLRGILSGTVFDDNECIAYGFTAFFEMTQHKVLIKKHVANPSEYTLPCQLDPHPSVDYACIGSTSFDTRKCEVYVPSGTGVIPKCHRNYYYPGQLLSMKCTEREWSDVFICKECGTVSETRNPLEDVSTEERGLPWHVKIYHKENDTYHLICGGTLVTARAVLTAAKCLRSKHQEDFYKEPYAVAVGNKYSLWNSSETNGGQTSFIIRIASPTETALSDEIVLAFLSRPFEFNDRVKPICLDLDVNLERKQLQDGHVAKTVRWVKKRDSMDFQDLEVLELEYKANCSKISNSELKFNKNNMCAEYKNATSEVCYLGGGSGLVFPDDKQGIKQYYLRGVAYRNIRNKKYTGNLTCFEENLMSFIFISDFRDFLVHSLLLEF